LDATGGLDTVEVPPGTVREAIEAAGRLFPQLKARVLTPQGEVDPSVNLYVNEEDIRALQGLDTPLQVGDELVILLAMSGG
jgi:molybdopterin converting factor small subunit